MRILSARARAALVLACFGVWAVLSACTVEEENPATGSRNRTTTSTEGGTVTPDSIDPTGIAICAKYGAVEGVNALAQQVLDRAAGDCRIAPLFAGRTTDTHFRDCFYAFVGSGFQCPGVTYVQGTTADSAGRRCESVLPGVRLSAEDWKAFADLNATPASNLRAVLEARELTIEELRAVGAVFEGKRAGLLNGSVPAGKYTQCSAGCALGGAACIRPQDAGTDGSDSSTPQDSGSG
jgi:hypothetical protein